jgi:hypothetical protein
MWKEAVVAYLKYNRGIFLEGPRNTIDLSYYSRRQGRNFNLGPTEYEEGIFNHQPRCSVTVCLWTLQIALDIQNRIIRRVVNNESEIMWDEEVVAQF